MSPIQYPTATAGGEIVTIRISMISEYLLSMNGISLENLLPKGHPGRLVQRMQIFASTQAEYCADPFKAPWAGAWIKRIAREEWPAIDAALDEALKKASGESQESMQAVTPRLESLAS